MIIVGVQLKWVLRSCVRFLDQSPAINTIIILFSQSDATFEYVYPEFIRSGKTFCTYPECKELSFTVAVTSKITLFRSKCRKKRRGKEQALCIYLDLEDFKQSSSEKEENRERESYSLHKELIGCVTSNLHAQTVKFWRRYKVLSLSVHWNYNYCI